MPAGYAIDDTTGLVAVSFAGELDGPAMLATVRALLADPRFKPGAPIIVDMAGLKRMDAGARDFLTLGEMQSRYVAEHGARSRLALMAPSDLGYGFGRMYQGFSDEEGQELISSVDDADEAAAWLNVDGATAIATLAAARRGLEIE